MIEVDHQTEELINNKQSHQDCLDKLQNFYVNKFNAKEDVQKFQAMMNDCMKNNGVDDDDHNPYKECTGL